MVIIVSIHIVSINPLQWRHNGCDDVSNHQPHDCLLNRLFRLRSKKTSKLRVTGLCVGNSPGSGEFPAHVASNVENVSISWRHHAHWRACRGWNITEVKLCEKYPGQMNIEYPNIVFNKLHVFLMLSWHQLRILVNVLTCNLYHSHTAH